MNRFFKEFKEFAIKGNMVDMAVGIIIGASFNKMLNTLVDKIITPPLSLLTEGVQFQNKEWVLRNAVIGTDGEITSEKLAIGYGEFLQVMIDFFIIAIVVFSVVKLMNNLRKKSEDTEDKAVETPKNIVLLDNLNKLMAEQNKILKSTIKHNEK
ncbi:large conductance mechanosensitive channel protein MscL [Weeksellaceae bacterium TAE3-ERU29]|nr:large conductance mechanosensitive channel protein MscL [Weeksellaceae bacterium TAE3-ERU29]